MTNIEAEKQAKVKLPLGETTIYRGYPIFHEDKREFRISFYANGLADAKKMVDWMIFQGCLEDEEQT